MVEIPRHHDTTCCRQDLVTPPGHRHSRYDAPAITPFVPSNQLTSELNQSGQSTYNLLIRLAT